MKRALARGIERLGELPIRRPWLVVLITLVTLVPSAWGASRLSVRSSLSELLPESKPSVVELR